MNEPLTGSRKITVTDACGGILHADSPDDGAGGRRFGLLVFFGGEAHLRLIDEGTSVGIGRERPSEIVIDDPSVSRQHARFIRIKDELFAEDLDSRNGTFRAGKRIQRERLEVGDEIVVGRARVVFAATRPLEPAAVPERISTSDDDFVLLNARMKQLYADVVRAAAGTLPVMVLGETGVGKEHIARAVHRESLRHSRPFVVVNCAAIPGSLLESTLFGHERGAFTGASARSVGVFERANEGVLFLDEIGDLGASAQVALLRAIETRRISRIGSSLEIPVDVRIVSATHCDLEAMVEEGTFRQDLFYRLNGIAFEVPPLRERQDEIEPLARHFLLRACQEWGVRPREMAREAFDFLRGCTWPGNVRQLRHAVERAALLAAGDTIGIADFPDCASAAAETFVAQGTTPVPVIEFALKQQLRRYERALIEEALRRAGGNRQAAAKLLRIPLRTLFRRIRLYGAQGAGVAEDRKDPNRDGHRNGIHGHSPS